MTQEISINDYVQVRLTEFGKRMHRKNHDDLMIQVPLANLPYTPPKEDEDGWSTWQLWVLMQHFGPYISMANDSPLIAFRIAPK